MINKTIIEQIAAREIASSPELFIVEINCTPHNEIEVIVDSDHYMTIDQCVVLSKAIEAELDRETEDFELTVASAGIGQPLKVERQYAKTVGRLVEVLFKNGLKILGTLVAADTQGIQIEYQVKEAVEGKKRKELVVKTEHYAFDEIKSVKEELIIK